MKELFDKLMKYDKDTLVQFICILHQEKNLDYELSRLDKVDSERKYELHLNKINKLETEWKLSLDEKNKAEENYYKLLTEEARQKYEDSQTKSNRLSQELDKLIDKLKPKKVNRIENLSLFDLDN
jgi:hypothetical protein